jgi:hypothetical protein
VEVQCLDVVGRLRLAPSSVSCLEIGWYPKRDETRRDETRRDYRLNLDLELGELDEIMGATLST